MGTSSSSEPGFIVVKNRVGVDVQLTSWCVPAEGVPLLENIAFDELVPHGYERRIEAKVKPDATFRVVVQLPGRSPFVLEVPCGATLQLKEYGGRGIARFCRLGAETWEVPTESDAASLLEGIVAARGIAAPASSLVAPQSAAPELQKGSEQLTQRPSRVKEGHQEHRYKACAEADAQRLLGEPDAIAEVTAPSAAAQPSATERRISVRTECICPISHVVFVDPVLAADGFTYERECIEEWWRRRGTRSPMTGKEVASMDLVPNLAIAALCADLLHGEGVSPSAEAHPEDAKDMQLAQAGLASFNAQVPLLSEMFAHLSRGEIEAVCAELAREGVQDIDVCVRRLLAQADSNGEVAAVSLAPVCCAASAEQVGIAAALLDPVSSIPDWWPEEREALFAELLEHQFPPVRARKMIEFGGADDLTEAVEWLERHQDDPDIDVPVEVLHECEAHKLALAVMRVATVPVVHRLECFQALHKILGRILADPDSQRLRQIRIHNEKFKRQVGRFRPAVALLKAVGFKQGVVWVSATQKESCLEFRLPVDSDNPISQRFVRAYSLLEEILRESDLWLASVGEAQPEVVSAWAAAAEELDDPAGEDTSAEMAPAAAGSRAYFADLHERRIRDPRGYREAMLAAGKAPNEIIVDVQTSQAEEDAARRLNGTVGAGSSGGQTGYRRLDERYGGRRHFNLQDLEDMRVEDAINGRTYYAQEYDEQKGTPNTYAQLLSRQYDPQYLGRKAVDDTNTFRAQNRMPPLKWSQALCDIAEGHAKQMARGEMPFSHQGFDDRVRRYPFAHMSAAENLAYNSGVSDAAGAAVQGWIKSPGHCKNLLGMFNLCGVGAAQSSSGQFFFTQLFARTPGPLC